MGHASASPYERSGTEYEPTSESVFFTIDGQWSAVGRHQRESLIIASLRRLAPTHERQQSPVGSHLYQKRVLLYSTLRIVGFVTLLSKCLMKGLWFSLSYTYGVLRSILLIILFSWYTYTKRYKDRNKNKPK
jgi:hypothetical protein